MPQPSIQTFSNNKKKWAYPISVVLLLLAMGLGISVGTFSISIKDILFIMGAEWFSMPLPDHISSSMVNIVMDIRLPRVILAGLVGAALAISGAAFQGLLQNPLADPYTLGISSGASLGAVCVLFFGIQIPFLGMLTLPAVSIVFGLVTILLVLVFARMIEKTMKIETIILTGIIVSSFLGSFISLMIALTGEELRHIIQWLLGSVSMRGWEFVWIIAPFFFIGSLLMLLNTKELNALSFGEEKAQYLGVNVKHRKFFILISASILTGAAVSVSGTIGFVGLLIPHMVRMIWGTNHQLLLPISSIIGASYLILADLISRTIISPTELPIGIITSLIGAPVFGFILLRRKKVRRG